MENPKQLTTPNAQLAASIGLIGVVLCAAVLMATVLGGPLERAGQSAMRSAERAWAESVLGGHVSGIDPDGFVEFVDPVFFGTSHPVVIYSARMNADTDTVAVKLITADGYNGDIEIALGIDAQGIIIAANVLSHDETRGFGAEILASGSKWLAGFTGRSLANPEGSRWRLVDEGGAIDGVSGATVTADATITVINRALRYLRHEDRGQ